MAKKDKDYIKALQASREQTEAYYRKSLVKTEQQKFLEQLLLKTKTEFQNIADIACGGGTLSFHLREIYPGAKFTLCDFNEEALTIAKTLHGDKAEYVHGSIYELPFENEKFDLVCCWQTLSWLDEPEKALNELLRITKKGGRIYASSLFNLRHDVDIFAKMYDHTRPASELGFSYNTYSAKSVNKWLAGKAVAHRLHEFIPEIDFHYDGRGIGTFTVKTENSRLQISAGYLMNWAVLEIEK
ncbi:MAG TPA: class I SAM-dependent methyltransferase [Bacteroidia bacterium]|nr:class I SAM-dependent methyltransferase [Bacteroidia bacterium]